MWPVSNSLRTYWRLLGSDVCVLLGGGSEQFSALCCFLVIFGQMQTDPHFLRTQGRTGGSLGVSEEMAVLKHNALEKVVEGRIKYPRYRYTWASDLIVLVRIVFNLIWAHISLWILLIFYCCCSLMSYLGSHNSFYHVFLFYYKSLWCLPSNTNSLFTWIHCKRGMLSFEI